MNRLTLITLAAALSSCAGTVPSGGFNNITPQTPAIVLHDDTFTVQVDPTRGGAVTYLSILEAGDTSGNVVDEGDQTGREIQASLYNGHWGPDSWPCDNAAQVWGWNPVQEGNACQTRSGGVVRQSSATSAVVESQPRQWNSRLGTARLDLRASVAIVAPGVLRLDYQVTNHETFTIGADNWHELPVAYLTPDFVTGSTSQGQTFTTPAIGFRDGVTDWIAASKAAGWTVAVVAPGDHLWSIGFGGGAHPTTWLQAWQWLELAPEQTGTATAWLVVGRSLDQVRARIQGVIR